MYDSILPSVRNEGVTWDVHARRWSVFNVSDCMIRRMITLSSKETSW